MLVRTEFSFGAVFGTVEAALARLPYGGIIADTTCFGHVWFAKAAAKVGKRAVLGWRARMVPDLEPNKNAGSPIIIIPRTPAGLRDLYEAVALAERQFYYTPRLTTSWIAQQLQDGVEWYVTYGTSRRTVLPAGTPGVMLAALPGAPRASPLVFNENSYPAPADREAWLFACPRARAGAGPGHILTPEELIAEGLPEPDPRWLDTLDTPLPRAENIHFGVAEPNAELRAQCEAELRRRPEGALQEYWERLEKELTLIAEKRFADYFLVIGDMIRWAKQRMLVGPARGSSCGSLVCWLTRITEVDPLRFGLIFERFVDLNRMDLPDIDIDFPDEQRHLVVEYLAEKYGAQNVAHLGTVLRYKGKSALTDVAKALGVPPAELAALKDVIIERSTGDSRFNECLRDSLEQLEAGRQLVARHPNILLATKLEGAAKTCGTHAAGIIVCNEPVSHFAAVGRGGIAQLDKKAAEALNMLKIDALGLRTLSVIETACAAAGVDRESLYNMPLDDQAAFAVLNDGRYSGIFQFEGLALQNVATGITFSCFDDIAAAGALARPGPLSSGETFRWIERHEGREEPTPPHPALTEITRDTYGVIMYQEQVMRIVRELGQFSWAKTSVIRKIMSSREGDESFAKLAADFIEGCAANGLPADEAIKIWKAINTFGSWAFNKSHSVAYGMVSYWCCWLKAHHPLEFALGCLRHSRDDESAVKILRELVKEGIDYVAFDAERSMESWSVQDGQLIGGLLGIKGIGTVTAAEIVNRRRNGIPLKPNHQRLLTGRSVFADIFPTRRLWRAAYEGNMFRTVVKETIDVQDPEESVIVIGRLVKKNLRDMNEEKLIVRRGGRRINGKSAMLMFMVEDDAGRMLCVIDRFKFDELGAPLVERGALGQWLAVKGSLNPHFRALRVENVKWLEESGC